MKRRMLCITLVLSMLFHLTGCTDKHSIQLKTIYRGQKIDLCAPEIREYLEAETAEKQASLLWRYNYLNAAYQATYFEWVGDGSTKYTVYFADNRKFENAESYETAGTMLNLYGSFLPGKTYYWKVVGDADGSSSQVDKFTTLDEPVRYISTSSIINVRDLGGWKTDDGKQVKYELIYRGGKTNTRGENECDERDVVLFREKLGICTEIDLRTPNEDDYGQTESVFGSDISYVKAPIGGYSYIIPGFKQSNPERSHNSKFLTSIRQLFEVLGEEENYPVYIHCNAGADRTGTIAFLINGVLGVSYEDLTRDFELTTFSEAGSRWRSGIVDGTSFDENGVMQDDHENFVAWDQMYDMIMDKYGTEDNTLKSAIENYLIEACRVEQEDINTLRKVMLED